VDKLGYKCLYMNARSIVNKHKELQLLVMEENLDIIAITETWLTDKIQDSEINILGYQLIRQDRQKLVKLRGGGVALYIRNELNALVRQDFHELNFPESLWCEINCKGEETLVGVCYRAPDSRLDQDEALYSLISKTRDKKVIILGDFNFTELDWSGIDKLDVSHPFVECLSDNFLNQLVDEPTREGRYLDLVLSTDESSIQNLEVGEPFETSDHQVVRFSLILNKQEVNKKLPVYDYFKTDYEDIRTYAGQLKWDLRAENSSSVEDLWNGLKADLTAIRDRFIEVKKKSKNKCKWATRKVIKLRKAKKKAWNNYTKNGNSSELYEIYKSRLKQSTDENNKAKCTYEKKLAENIKQDPKSFYAYVSSKRTVASKVGPLKDSNGGAVSNNKVAADLLNTYFSSVFTKEDLANVPEPKRIFNSEEDEIFARVDITEELVLSKLSGINVGKCQGPDEIHAKLLYELRQELAKPLARLFSLALQRGRVPQDWKDANVAPLHKKGSRSKPENYRPVSLTCIIGKILEGIIKESLVLHLMRYDLIRDTQHGFTSGKSCLTNLLDFFETITKKVDEGNSVDLIYLDFAKAFDKVPYHRLCKKLAAHGIGGEVLYWVQNWLCNRRQRVCVDGEFSEWVAVTSGVPQGSVLGPILFLIYINDLDVDIVSKLGKFADDSKLGKSVDTVEDVELIRQDLAKLERWSEDWQMQFNTDKCSVIHVGRKNNLAQYTLNGKILKTASNDRDLGVTIDKTLKFSEQCNSVVNSANSTLGMIRRTINCKSKDIIVSLYKALVRPKLEYCVQAWRPYLRKDIDKLEKVQRRATKMIEGCGKMSYEDRLKFTGLTTLEDRRNRGDLIEVFKTLKGFNRVDYRQFFKLVEHSRTRGHSFKLVKSRSRLEIRKNFFSQRVVNSWNNLPESVVEAETVNSFKNRYDKCYKHG